MRNKDIIKENKKYQETLIKANKEATLRLLAELKQHIREGWRLYDKYKK